MADRELVWHATAAANILAAQKRNGRVGGRKSKQGCLTCKQRRIKCDETQPACKNCTSSQRRCLANYSDGKKKSPKSNNTLLGVHLSHALGLVDDSERNAFDHFLSWTSPRLAGAFDREFWCGQVLRVAHTEPAILDALLAISALYEFPSSRADGSGHDKMRLPRESVGASALGTGRPEAYIQRDLDNDSEAALVKQHVLGTKLHNRAMRKLMDQVNTGKSSMLVALLSCVLFICVEMLRDDIFAALNLFTKGYQILSQIKPSDPDFDAGLYHKLKLTMTRLGILAAMYGHPDLLENRAMVGEIDETSGIGSMEDARTALYTILADSLAFHRAAIPWKKDALERLTVSLDDSPVHVSSRDGSESNLINSLGCSPATSSKDMPAMSDDGDRLDYTLSNVFAHLPAFNQTTSSSPHVPDALVQQQAHFEARLHTWLGVLQRLIPRPDETLANLMIWYHASILLIGSRLCLDESIYDNYTHHFEEILHYAELYYSSCPTTQSTSFTFEPGPLPGLWYVATKCRVSNLRQKAVQLMRKAPKKECMWGRESMATFAARVIAIEEEGLLSCGPSPECLVPEPARVHELVMLNGDEHGSGQKLRVTRYVQLADGRRVKSIEEYPV